MGIPCAGKTTIGAFLAETGHFRHVESSSVLPAAAAKFGYEDSDKARLANTVFSSNGFGVVEEHAVSNGLVPVRGRTVYTGVRTIEGVAVLLSHAHSHGVPCFVLLVNVEVRLAIDRNAKRARDIDTSSASYHERLRWDFEFGAVRYGTTMADWRITNTTSLENLRRSVDIALAELVSGRNRRDDATRRQLLAAGPTGDLDMPVASPGWLGTNHPTLVDGNVLSSRGLALFRILHLR